MNVFACSRLLLTSRIGIRCLNHFRCISSANGKITSSYYHEKGTFSFLHTTLADLVDEAADDCGDDTAFIFPFQNIRKTFQDFRAETDQLASGLISLGLKIGDRIAICGPNSYQWILTQYASFKAGLIPVCINPVSTEQELEYTLQKVECRAIVTAENFKTKNYYKTLCGTIPELPHSQPGQINSQRLKKLEKVIIFSDTHFPGTYRLKDVMEADGSDARRLLNDTRKKIQFDNPAFIMFTSGTTGKPKAAVISHFNVLNQSRAFVNRVEFWKEKPVNCLQVPLFHVFGSVGGPPMTLLSRGKCVFPSEHFDLISSLKSIEQEKCNIAYGVPTMFNEILQYLSGKQFNLHHWKTVVVGASPVPLELMKRLREEFGLTILNGYGATEITGALSVQSPSDSHIAFGSTGKPVEYIEVKIVDGQGNIVPVNTNGEVLSRSPYVFSGYWKEAEKTAEAIDSSRWYHTGDIGRMDEDGYIYVTGRIKDMVIRGGENIYPSEIENFLLKHPSVSDVYVVGVPDKRLGEELCAAIKLKEGSTITEDEIKAFCKDKISYYKIPRYILFCEDFPKTETGKIIKYNLRDVCVSRLKL